MSRARRARYPNHLIATHDRIFTAGAIAGIHLKKVTKKRRPSMDMITNGLPPLAANALI